MNFSSGYIGQFFAGCACALMRLVRKRTLQDSVGRVSDSVTRRVRCCYPIMSGYAALTRPTVV